MKKINIYSVMILALLIITPFFQAQAETKKIKAIVVFGDSLSDQGRFTSLIAGIDGFQVFLDEPFKKNTFPLYPGAPYYKGRFSNGPVWTDYLALDHLKAYKSDDHSNIDTNRFRNYATGGSGTGIPFNFEQKAIVTALYDTTLSGQVSSYLNDIDSNVNKWFREPGLPGIKDTLFIFWTGGNDYVPMPLIHDLATTDTTAFILFQIERLISNGAQHFLILNLPGLRVVPGVRLFEKRTVNIPDHLLRHLPKFGPEITRKSVRVLSTADYDITPKQEMAYIVNMHNAKLKQYIDTLNSLKLPLTIKYVDIYKKFDEILDHLDQYGFKKDIALNPHDHIAQACYPEGYDFVQASKSSYDTYRWNRYNKIDLSKQTKECDGYLFFDNIHPTTKAHEIIAKVLKKELDKHNFVLIK